MEQRKLYKVLESIIRQAPSFETNEELLSYVLENIINIDSIDISGGRLWKLDIDKKSYTLISQKGDISPIEKDYKLNVKDYPVFKSFGQRRAFIAYETNEYLIKRGIYIYSAAGVGERCKISDKKNKYYYLYKYLIALNGNEPDEDFINTLNIISVTLSPILRTRKLESKAKENIVELEKASEIQKNILPEHELKFGNYEMFGVSLPEKIVGGDFFDYLKCGDDYKISVVIADAASKGISAAAQALYVSGALKMGVSYDVSNTTLIKKINNLVYDTFPYERFLTLFYCELYQDKKGLCVYINAGHNPPYHLNHGSDKISVLKSTGPVLGPSANQNYFTEYFHINVNDLLILYTDGIIEAANSNFEFYGEERLKNAIKKFKEMSAKDICHNILDEVQKFGVNGRYSDDKTIVVIKRIK
ncbi:MAG: PP2C family protein-serine/threonine phosphatase [Ignavibacteria bacterium]|nr:PP2C family protein-serine/threonine phosphatase [Ignavibacteria bacterium]